MEYSSLLIDLLYQMAYADGKFNAEEKQFVSQIIEESGFTADSLIEERKIPKEEKDRMTILYYLLFLIKIDNKVEEQEKNFARKFGTLLGFRIEMVNKMLEVMENHLEARLPDDELVKIIRQYMN